MSWGQGKKKNKIVMIAIATALSGMILSSNLAISCYAFDYLPILDEKFGNRPQTFYPKRSAYEYFDNQSEANTNYSAKTYILASDNSISSEVTKYINLRQEVLPYDLNVLDKMNAENPTLHPKGSIYSITPLIESNTSMPIVVDYTVDKSLTKGIITENLTDYLNINKTEYTHGEITYSYNSSNGILTPTILGAETIIDNVEYIGNNQTPIISNNATGTITGDFIGNKSEKSGGAISVKANNLTIIGNFIANNSNITDSDYFGGAMYLSGTVDRIIGDFISNRSSQGGGIYNTDYIYWITGDFIGNRATIGDGGAINNSNTTSYIKTINGNFVNNYAKNEGGAIYNNGEIADIEGNFIKNSATAGGAIRNSQNGKISAIEGIFIGNESKNSGGAIRSEGTISSIHGNFINNSAGSYGGAIYGYGGMETESVYANFISNSAVQNGGAISGGTLTTIYGDFIANSALNGGAISDVNITNLYGDFIYNTASEEGGAIFVSDASITSINSDFIGNSALLNGGAISNHEGTINTIIGNFINNTSKNGMGGAIYNIENGQIGTIEGSFTGNSATHGGGIRNNSIITSVSADFIKNEASEYGGAIYNHANGEMSSLTGKLISNSVQKNGGALSGGTITDISADFINNTAGEKGGAISCVNVENLSGNFKGNTAIEQGGAIWLASSYKISNLQSNFTNNSTNGNGGAIYNAGTLTNITGTYSGNTAGNNGGAIYSTKTSTIGEIKNATFTGNTAVNHGGAIYTATDMKIIADGKTSKFQGNSTTNYGNEAIYVAASDATLTLEAKNSSSIDIYDSINGSSGYNLNLTGDSSGYISLLGDIRNADVSADTVHVNFADGKIKQYSVNTLTSDNSAKYIIDVNVSTGTSDTIRTLQASTGTVTLDKLNVISGDFDAITDKYFKIRILNTQNSDLQLALSSNLISSLATERLVGTQSHLGDFESLKQVTNWTDKYSATEYTDNFYGIIGLATTYTQNDSIGMNITNVITTTSMEEIPDTLAYVNQTELANRSFVFDSAENIYVSANDAGITAAGGFTINGKSNGNGKSTIDFNWHNGFEISDNNVILNINDTKLIHSSGDTISNYVNEAILNFNNVEIAQSDCNGIYNEGIVNAYNLKLNNNYDNAIHNYSGSMNLTNLEITDNYNSGIVNDIGTMTITNAIIEANGYAGIENYSGILALKNADLIDNHDYGITNYNADGLIDLSDVNISGSYTGIYNEYGTTNLSDVIITNTYYGIENYEGKIDIKNSNIQSNIQPINTHGGTINLENVTISGGINGIYNDSGVINITGKSIIDVNGPISIYNDGAVISINNTEQTTINSVIEGNPEAKFAINNSKFNITNSILNVETMLNKSQVNLLNESLIMGSMNVTGASSLNLVNNNTGTVNLTKFSLHDNLDLFADVDLNNITMDKFTAPVYDVLSDYIVNVTKMNLLSDAKEDLTVVHFADDGLKYNVSTPIKSAAYSPIYKYSVKYDPEHGDFIFTRGNGSSGNSYGKYNPAILSSIVTTQSSGSASMDQTFQYIFEHADTFTQLPAKNRFAKINANKFAISTDFNNNLGRMNYETLNNKGIWVRPYSSFDTTKYKNGPHVHSVNYGTIVGGDSDFRRLRNGWTNVITPYLGYFGSQISHKGVDTNLNGGLIGLTETFYKGNFFTAITASVGAGAAESHSMYGKDDISMLMAGIASKNGYNIEFAEGRFIIQPLLKLEYTMVNTFDYTNAAGVKINSDPLHTIHFNPAVRFITNIKDDIQAYASVGMVYNLMNETNVTANGITLPEMRMRPYVEYGAGIQKSWNEGFSAFGQAMVRNGYRSGIALTFGFRWALDGFNFKNRKYEKVHKQEKNILPAKISTTNNITSSKAISPSKVIYSQKSLTNEDIKQKEVLYYSQQKTLQKRVY